MKPASTNTGANTVTNDDSLVVAVQAGDIHSFDPLVERHLDAVHAFVALKLPLREERNRLAYAERRELEEALATPATPDAPAIEALNACLDAVPGHLRTLLNLRYHDEHSSEQIASRLGRTLAWVRTTLCRVRQQLRDCIARKLKALPS